MGTGCSTQQHVTYNHAKSGENVGKLIENVPVFKIVLIGDPKVGKTNVFLRYMKNQFDVNYIPNQTVDIHNVVRKINVPENTVVAVTMWDLPGREDMDLRKTYYTDVDAAIVVVDITDDESIEMAGTWKHDVLNNATIKTVVTVTDENGQVKDEIQYKPAPLGSIPVVLFGNKYDLIEDQTHDVLNDSISMKSTRSKKSKSLLNESAKSLPDVKESNDNTSKNVMIDELTDEVDRKVADDETDNKVIGAGDILSGDVKDVIIPDTYRKEGNIPDEFFIDDPLKKISVKEENNNTEENNNMNNSKLEEISEVPDCIKLLEEIEKTYGFISSFHVSAKNPDGNIDIAVQALIRLLLEKKGKLSAEKMSIQKKTESENTKTGKNNKVAGVQQQQHVKDGDKDKNSEMIDSIGIPELDEIFSRCRLPTEITLKFQKTYKKSVKSFKKTCLSSGIIETAQCSLEDCILCLKSKLGDDKLLDVVDDEGFIKLDVHGLNEEITDNIQQVLTHFNEQFGSVCKTILKESENISVSFEKINNLVKVQAEEIIEKLNTDNNEPTPDGEEIHRKPNVPALVKKIDINRAKIMHVQELVHKNIEEVENAKKKVKTALLW